MYPYYPTFRHGTYLVITYVTNVLYTPPRATTILPPCHFFHHNSTNGLLVTPYASKELCIDPTENLDMAAKNANSATPSAMRLDRHASAARPPTVVGRILTLVQRYR